MRKTKLEKGITLVALIITIVVLLILAVVSIGAVKNSGIIGHASNTTARWEQEQANEASGLKDLEDFLEENNPNKEENNPNKKLPYDEFWQAVYELYEENKDEDGFMILGISEHVFISCSSGGLFANIFYGDYMDGDRNIQYYIGNKDYDNCKANEWYAAASGSEIDSSKTLGLPEKILTDKAGTPVAGYEELCDLFNKAVETHAESIN